MSLQKWLALCDAVKDHRVRAATALPFTDVVWDNAFKGLLIMHADGMSSEESDVPVAGGKLLTKRKAAWRSKGLQDFLRTVRSHMKVGIQLAYAAQDDEPLLGTRPAPAGLEAPFYDEEYVMGLSIAAREDLNMQ
jgi:hypothetical protein